MELDYCVPKGIPHSEFLDWDATDQDKVIAWILDKNSKCPDCSTVIDEWLDEQGVPLEPPPFDVVVSYCHGCHIIDREREEIKASDPDRIGQMKLYLRPATVAKALSSLSIREEEVDA